MVRALRPVVAVPCLFLALPAAAATLTTSFVTLGENEAIICNAVNAGSKPIEVTIRVVEISPVTTRIEETGEIAPGDGDTAGFQAGSEDFFGYCQFEVAGSSKAIRAVAIKIRADDSEVIVLPAQ